jgi:hypothetical protein
MLLSGTGAGGTTTTSSTPDPGDCISGCTQGNAGIDGTTILAGVFEYEPGELIAGEPAQGGSSYLADCNWQFAPAETTATLHPVAGAWEVTFPEDHWLVWCAPFTVVYTFFPAADGPDPVVLADMIRDAYYRTPVIAFNPQISPEGSDDIPLIVQTKNWLWVDEALWDTPVDATASIPPISITTTATAYKAVWTGGDEPETLECTDHGAPYVFGIGGPEANDDTCTVVFTQDSILRPDQSIDMAVHWAVEFTCTAYCIGGTLPDIVTQSTRPVEVTEIQAVSAPNS